MAEQRAPYQTNGNLSRPLDNNDMMDAWQQSPMLDLSEIERKLIPLLNEVRRQQGKRPVIVPRE